MLAHVLYALDPRAVRDFRLGQRGLEFVEPNMNLVALRPGGGHIVLPRDRFWARSEIAELTAADSAAYGRFRRWSLAFARKIRPLWQAAIEYIEPDEDRTPPEVILRRLGVSASDALHLDELARSSAAAYLDRWFESDALKAALSFDACMDGRSPYETGSALALIWRLAQESCGIQAAVSQPRGGPGGLVAALAGAARDHRAEIRMNAPVSSVLVERGRAAGVELENGGVLRANAIVSNLDRRRTLLDLVPPGAIGFGAAAGLPESSRVAEAKVLLALGGPPPFAGLEERNLRGRFVVAERPESAGEAKSAALAGELGQELSMEVTVPTAAEPDLALEGSHVLSVLVRYVPLAPNGKEEASREMLAKRAIAALEKYAPGVGDRIVAMRTMTPGDIAARYGGTAGGVGAAPLRLLSTYAERLRTPLPGLFLCGSDAEPVSAISGRAGRVAASHVYRELRNATERAP